MFEPTWQLLTSDSSSDSRLKFGGFMLLGDKSKTDLDFGKITGSVKSMYGRR